MALPITLNKPAKLSVSCTLAGAPGSVDPNTPIVWAITPAANGTITPAADGMTADVTLTVLGGTTIEVTGDGNLASGVLNVVVTDTLTVLDAVNIGADGGTVAIV